MGFDLGLIDILEAVFFKPHGPWVLLTVCVLVIWRLVVFIQNLQIRHQETIKTLLIDHNKQQREETAQLIQAMLSTEKALQAVNDTLNAIIARKP